MAGTPGPTTDRAASTAPPVGLLMGPFLVGTGMVLALAWLLEIPLGLPTVAVALVIGALFAAFALLSRLQRQQAVREATPVAEAPSARPGAMRQEAMAAGRPAGDPLAHIHRMEDTGRRYAQTCTNCGQEIQGDPVRCPNCDHKLRFECKRCRTSVKLEWGRCPECAAEL